MFEQPFDPSNSNWDVYAINNDVMESHPSDIWEFLDYDLVESGRNVWHGNWKSIRENNDRIIVNNDKKQTATVIFLNDDRFIALSGDNVVILYGKKK
jgi:hypothetical protein